MFIVDLSHLGFGLICFYCCCCCLVVCWGFLSQGSFIISIWSMAWERAPRRLKSFLVAAGRGSGPSPGTGRMPEGPLKGCWVSEAPSHA